MANLELKSNGTWRVRFRKNGKRLSAPTHTTNYAEALKVLKWYQKREKAEREAKKFGYIEEKAKPKEIQYLSFLKAYLENYKKKFKKTSFEAVFYGLQTFTKWLDNNCAISKLKLSDIDKRIIENYRADLINNKYAEATVNRYMKDIKAFFNTAIDWEYLEKTPVSPKLKKLKEPEKYRMFSEYQIAELFQLIDQKSTKFTRCSKRTFKNIIRMALNTAARYGEILNLRVGNIKGDSLIIPQMKQKRDKIIPITSEINTIIEQETDERSVNAKSFLFVDLNGMPFQNNNHKYITYRFHKLLQKCSFYNPSDTGLRFHDLRHTAISYLLHKGIDIKTVMAISGHSEMDTVVKIYSHVSQNELIKASENLGGFTKSTDQILSEKASVINIEKLRNGL